MKEEPAFPQTIDDSGTIRSNNQGLTKREWFAGMIMQGMLASPELMQVLTREEIQGNNGKERLCGKAFEYSDAMIEASKK